MLDSTEAETWLGSELAEGCWLGAPQGSSIHTAGLSMSSSQLNCASAIVKFLYLGSVLWDSSPVALKLNHCTTAPGRGAKDGPGLIDSTGEPVYSAHADLMERLPSPLAFGVPVGLELKSGGVRIQGGLESAATAAAASSSARSAEFEGPVTPELCPSEILTALNSLPVEGGSVRTLPVFPSDPLLPEEGAPVLFPHLPLAEGDPQSPVLPLPRTRDRSSWARSVLRLET